MFFFRFTSLIYHWLTNQQFFEIINGGGLKYPINSVYMACTPDKTFCEIKNSAEFDIFLRLSSSKDFLLQLVKCLDDEGDLHANQIIISLNFWREIIMQFIVCFV